MNRYTNVGSIVKIQNGENYCVVRYIHTHTHRETEEKEIETNNYSYLRNKVYSICVNIIIFN